MTGGSEQGIVAESALPFLLMEDLAFDGTAGYVDDFAALGKGEDTAEAGGAVRRFAKGTEELLAVSGIGRARTGIASGMNAGSTAEGIDFQSGVIGEDKIVREKPGGVERLDPGVVFERFPVLHSRLDLRKAVEIEVTGEAVPEDRLNFYGLVGIVGCDDEPGHPDTMAQIPLTRERNLS